MERFMIACVFVLMSAFCRDAAGHKPAMKPLGGELILEEWAELRIECYSKGAELWFSFPEDTFMIPRSEHEIRKNGDGNYTFLRRHAYYGDSGWYACATEGTKIDNSFKNLNHTHENISWIYVYMTLRYPSVIFGEPALASLHPSFPKTIIVVAATTAVVPCRPVYHRMYLELWQNFELVNLSETVRFDPKIGFIMDQVAFENSEAIIYCAAIGAEAARRDNYILRFSDATGPKPTMITAGTELVLQEGNDLRIECYSETKINFLFPEIESSSSNSSDYEILTNGNGTSTFLRHRAIANHTGWYGCTGADIGNNIPYYSINYTRDEISWIYVYVNSPVRIVSGSLVYGDADSEEIFVPCQPTSPGLNVTLNVEDCIDEYYKIQFEPKLGFLVRPAPPNNCVFYCTTDKPVQRDAKNHLITYQRTEYPQPIISDTDGESVSSRSVVRISEEDLRIVCEASAIETTMFRLEWTIPKTVSKDRVHYNRTSSYVRAEDNQVYMRRKKLITTITNITESDSGKYTCLSQTSRRKFTASTSVVVIVSTLRVVRMEGETFKCLVDLGDFPTTKMTWYDAQDHRVGNENYRGFKFFAEIVKRHGHQMLFEMTSLITTDSGVHQLHVDTGNRTVLVNVDLEVQAPSRVLRLELPKYSYGPNESFDASCSATGSPLPSITWSFLKQPKFPSPENATRVDYEGKIDLYYSPPGVLGERITVYSLKNIFVGMSGALTCTACNVVNCTDRTRRILFVASPEPYFTSTNMNQSVTVSLETYGNKTLILECFVGGSPRPKVTWFQDGIPIEEGNPQFKLAYDNSELRILYFPFGNGAGKYTCRAENEHGSIEKHMDVIIAEKTASDVLQPSLISAAVVLLAVSWLIIYRLRVKASRRKFLTALFQDGALNQLNPGLSISDQAELLPYERKWEFPRELLTLDKILGSGAFGIVRKGEARSICRGEPVTTVAVKLVRGTASLNFITALTRELKILIHLGKHTNVVNLLGACTKDVSWGELLVIVEYCRFGNLHDYLIRHRAHFVDETHSEIAAVGSNLDDVNDEEWSMGTYGAARNILLADKGIVKICDFGLAKALYEEAQYRNEREDPMPIRWMAVEAIKDRVFSFQSDVWSFGVVMWEFFTLARTPYPGIRSRDLYHELANGHRMGKPQYATRTIYKTMLECWETEPANRPSFTELEEILGDSLDEDFKTQYFELDSPYEKMNADDLENEKTDYLTMSPSSIIATASPVAHEEIEMVTLTGTGSENPGANA